MINSEAYSLLMSYFWNTIISISNPRPSGVIFLLSSREKFGIKLLFLDKKFKLI
jgi:hypothetical protein